jgi:hypothetical protein
MAAGLNEGRWCWFKDDGEQWCLGRWGGTERQEKEMAACGRSQPEENEKEGMAGGGGRD